MSEPAPTALPAWAREIIDLYESGASAQFILHGNVSDRVLLTAGDGKPRPGSLDEFLREVLLAKFDVILTYDLGNGTRVEKGGERFAEWPAWKDKTLPAAPRDAVHVLTHYLRFCANVSRLKPERTTRVAILVKNAGLIVPPPGGGPNYELSAIASQQLLPKPGFSALLELVESAGLYGLNVAHSGSVVGLLLDRRMAG